MKKNFAVNFVSPSPEALEQTSPFLTKPTKTIVDIPPNPLGTVSVDFKPFYGQGFDNITAVCQRTIEKLKSESLRTNGHSLSFTSIVGFFFGFRVFARYLSLLHAACGEDLTMKDLTPEIFKQFVHYLQQEPIEYSGQSTYFYKVKNLFTHCNRLGLWPQVNIKSIFPSKPFPYSHRRVKGQKALTKNEKRQVVRGLRLEMERIVSETEVLNGYDLTACALSIALSTGMNPTPIRELLIDCVQPHPLKANLRLLVSFKRRGKTNQVVAIPKTNEVAEMASIHLHAANAIDLIVARNEKVRAQSSDPQRLFVYPSESINRHKPIRLSQSVMNHFIKSFTSRHQIVTDDGEPMILNISRLRKTLLNRVWELSGQDPLMAARTGRHSIKTGDAHYWQAPPEAEANMHFIGKARVTELLENGKVIASDRTPVASCADNKQGHRAPKDGSLCQDFLGCFRCKSFVVTGDDLYRLFSFYWAAVRGHASFGGKRWKKYLRQVIRLIDSEIAPCFDKIVVNECREKAKTDPHPFWKDLSMARMAV